MAVTMQVYHGLNTCFAQTFPQAKYSLIAELGSPGGVYAGIDSAFFLVANNLVVAYEWQNWEKLADRWIK